MEGKIISRENIKPSSPTPHDQKIHKISFIDQIIPAFYFPMVFYFPNPEITPKNADFISQTTQILKQSLSATLTRFYPLAGRVIDTLSIDCNDEGVLLVVAKFETNLSDFLKNPDPEACRAHLPGKIAWAEPGPETQVAMIQANYFDCGGIVIGSLFHHKFGDGVTFTTFMKAWAANARGETVDVGPNFMLQSLFPHNESMEKRESHLHSVFGNLGKYLKIGKTVMRRYVFDEMSISRLGAQLGDEGLKHRPTRVEIVSAVMWKYFMVASATHLNKSSSDNNNNNNSISLVTHGVNMRRKAEPQFPDNSFGNFVWTVPAWSLNNEPDRDLKTLLVKVQNAIGKVDGDFVKRMEGDDGFSGYCKNLEDSWSQFNPDGNGDYLSITSWCNLGLYSVDFGWGRPVWVHRCDAESDVKSPCLNVLWLMDTRQGDGIEAWLILDEQQFAAFDETDQELRGLASVDPSPMDHIDCQT